MNPQANEVVSKLLNSAKEAEIPAVVEVAIRAGYLWKCECSYINMMGNPACDGCGKESPPEYLPSQKITHVSWVNDLTLCGRTVKGETVCTLKEAHERSNCEVCLCRVGIYGTNGRT